MMMLEIYIDGRSIGRQPRYDHILWNPGVWRSSSDAMEDQMTKYRYARYWLTGRELARYIHMYLSY